MQYRMLGLIMILSLLNINAVQAKDLGTVGPTYKITETNLLHFIYDRLNQYQKEGRLEQLQQQFVKQVQKQIERPVGSNVTPAIKNNSWLFDPSLQLQKDITNEKGQMIAAAGTVVNPLAYVHLSKELVFINGDIDKELYFAKIKINQKPNTKIILVSGNIKEVNKKLNLPVYFDQGARLIGRFGVQHTPAVVMQDGNNLRISEIAL